MQTSHARWTVWRWHDKGEQVGSGDSLNFGRGQKIPSAGANPNGISVDLTPLSYAASESDEQMIKCLLEAGADPTMLDSVY
ncbi:hypothetical protein OROGR_001969 [Orobanche gracilis]